MNIRQNLQQAYNQNNWKKWFPEIFGTNVSIESKAERVTVSNSNAKSIERFALLKLKGNKYIAVLDITTDKNVQIGRNKVGLRNLVAKLIDQDKYHGILAFYHSEDTTQKDCRLSFISNESSFDDDGNFKTNSTNPRRFTYTLGEQQSCNTAAKRLAELQKKKDIALEDVSHAFSVSNLTKEFYNELYKWYEWALSEEVGITFPKNTDTPDDNREKLEEQIIRLITRLLFVWFIKQKDLVPHDLFDVNKLNRILKDFDPNDKENGSYYNAILQNLFFATLNKPIVERAFAKEKNSRDIKTLYRYAEMFCISEKKIIELFKPIPFLNGGLFECLDKDTAMDGVKYHLDGFSRNDKKVKGQYSHRAFIPNYVFFDQEKGIIPLLERYNFTIEENSPEDVEIALDPELLGNVFENLLGAFNNETKESARKQSGSFYTPREIVDFMVSESLQAYLKRHVGEIDLDGSLTDAEKRKIYNTLRNVKILDPACGSGAFPMGILNGIIAMLEKIGVAKTLDMYELKLHIIEKCIYGIDIQTIASQISKLRFFISLIVEQKGKDPSKENYGVITLPNLETKFVAGNTLLGLHKKQAQGNLFEDPRIEAVKQEILAVRHKHFYAKTARDKKLLREKDARLRNELVKLLENNHEFAPEDAKQVATWNPYDQNSSSPFFDIEWMFGIKDGFDIVIGNPPYFSLSTDSSYIDTDSGKKIKHNKLYEHQDYKVLVNSGDIYSLFYEKGWNILKPHGILCFITSNKWMRAAYGESSRKFFAEHTDPLLIIDFAGQKVFDSATVDVNILMFAKDKNRQQTRACVIKERPLNNLSVFVRQFGVESVFSSKESWTILSPIEQRIKEKIERIGVPLKNWDIQINYGIKTGFNEAFIIDGEKRKELIAEDPKSDEIIRPILRGRDILRYGYKFADLWLINTHNGIKEKGIKPVNINDYPAIKRWFDFGGPAYNGKVFKGFDQIKSRADQGDTPYNLRNCAYTDDFSKQKILWAETMRIHKGITGNFPRFGIENNGEFVTDKTCFFATGKHIKFIAGVLNSDVGRYLLSQYVSILDDGGYLMQKIYLEKIPMPPFSPRLEKLVEKQPDKVSEDAINRIVYQLYNLTEDEVAFIENSKNLPLQR